MNDKELKQKIDQMRNQNDQNKRKQLVKEQRDYILTKFNTRKDNK
jgi:hypothetical protein